MTSTSLVSEDVLDKENQLQEMQGSVSESTEWLDEKIQDRKDKTVGLIDDAATGFAEQTGGELDALSQGEVFKGTFINNNAARGQNFMVHFQAPFWRQLIFYLDGEYYV